MSSPSFESMAHLGGSPSPRPTRQTQNGVVLELADLSTIAGVGGVVWSAAPQGVHVNLVVLEPGGAIAAHRNDALDVLVVVLSGAGHAVVDDEEVQMEPMRALLVPRGSERSFRAATDGLRYLTVHAQRGPMGIGGPRTGKD
jgi:quercetin dioxygenase-like cupin family protein